MKISFASARNRRKINKVVRDRDGEREGEIGRKHKWAKEAKLVRTKIGCKKHCCHV